MGGYTKLTRVALIAEKDISMMIIRLLGTRAVLDRATGRICAGSSRTPALPGADGSREASIPKGRALRGAVYVATLTGTHRKSQRTNFALPLTIFHRAVDILTPATGRPSSR